MNSLIIAGAEEGTSPWLVGGLSALGGAILGFGGARFVYKGEAETKQKEIAELKAENQRLVASAAANPNIAQQLMAMAQMSEASGAKPAAT